MLRPRQILFVAELVKGSCSAKDAAIRAGYAPKNARQLAHNLLRNPEIRAAVREGRDHIAARNLITADRLLAEVAIVAFSDLGDFMDFSGNEIVEKRANTIDPKKRRALQSVKITTKTVRLGRGDDALTETTRTVEYKLWDKPAALDKLAKHLGVFLDQDEIKRLLEKADELRARTPEEPPQ
jgi:phage terminase small subunit